MPEGIGYVSYNTYPGWHMRGTIRDMMCHHIGRFAGEPPARQVGAGPGRCSNSWPARHRRKTVPTA